VKRLLVWAQISALFFASQCAAAISVSTVWEVRTTGADTQGGGFVAGATGTDMSQFDNKNAAACSSCQSSTANLSTVDATANGTTTITSATAVFSAAIVGNVIEFSGGTGSIAAVWKQVTGFTNATTITIDSSIAVSTGMTMNIGGALATIGKALGLMVGSNIIFVKATATYTITASLVLAGGTNLTPTNATTPNQVIGYTTSRTDAGRATIQFSTNTGITAFDGTNAGGWYISNFVIDCNNLGSSIGARPNVNSVLRNLLVKNCTSQAVNMANGTARLIDSEITLNAPAAGTGAVNQGGQSTVERCYVHDNTLGAGSAGIYLHGTGAAALFNVVANNTGASGHGILVDTGSLNTIFNNTIYNNGQDGIQFSNNQALGSNSTVRNNLLISNGRYGLNGYISPGWGKFPQWDGNAYFGNATAARNDADDTGSTNPINAANPYSNTLDVTLSGSPFTNTATHDFTLNSTAGAGAAAKGTATPGALPGLSQTGSMSFGALQPTTAAGATQSGQAFTQ
jgi:parallel beta helix pectate lyase-like protein